MATVSIAFGSGSDPFNPSFGIRSFKPAIRRVLGTLTVDGNPAVRTVLLMNTAGVLLASTTSAADGSFSFTVNVEFPLLLVGVGANTTEQPVAHFVFPGV